MDQSRTFGGIRGFKRFDRRMLGSCLAVSSLMLAACAGGVQDSRALSPSAPGSASQASLSIKAAAADGVALSAPQIAMVSVPTNFTLNVPSGLTVTLAQWSFGDGSPIQNGAGPFSHAFFNAGPTTVQVTFTDSKGQT